MFPSKTIPLLLAGHFILVTPQETDTSSDISTSTESQPVTEPVGLEYFLGENGNKLIFDEDSADPEELSVLHRLLVPPGGAPHSRGDGLRAPRLQGLQGRDQDNEASLQLV